VVKVCALGLLRALSIPVYTDSPALPFCS